MDTNKISIENNGWVNPFPIVEEALRVLIERQAVYDGHESSFPLIAKFWDAYLNERCGSDVSISGRDVAIMMILLKVAREMNKPQHDNFVDIIGYSAHADAQTEKFKSGSVEKNSGSKEGANDMHDSILDILRLYTGRKTHDPSQRIYISPQW